MIKLKLKLKNALKVLYHFSIFRNPYYFHRKIIQKELFFHY